MKKLNLNFKWFSRFRKRERIFILAAVISLCVYLLLALAVIPLVRNYYLMGTLITEKETILRGYLETLEREKTLKRKSGSLLAAARVYDQYILDSAKPALAAAELQKRVKQAASIHGLDIISEKIAKPTRHDHYVIIPVEITAKGAIGPLKDFLYDIESGKPLLSIPVFSIRISKRRIFDASTKKYKDIEELQATIVINEIMKGGA